MSFWKKKKSSKHYKTCMRQVLRKSFGWLEKKKKHEESSMSINMAH